MDALILVVAGIWYVLGVLTVVAVRHVRHTLASHHDSSIHRIEEQLRVHRRYDPATDPSFPRVYRYHREPLELPPIYEYEPPAIKR